MNVNIEDLIVTHAATISAALPSLVAATHSEEEIKVALNALLEDFLKAAGMPHVGRHEYGLAGGRIDSKYGKVIIEYKHPHKNPLGDGQSTRGAREVVRQLKERFSGFRKAEAIAPGKLFGVGCDGNRFIFVRYRGKELEVTGPSPATPRTVDTVLRALVSLGAQGPSFTPEDLAARFGSESALAQEGVRSIYETITATGNPKAKTFFNQWKILFGEVCGYDVEGRNAKIEKLATHYGLAKAQPSAMLFSVHTYYAIFIKFLAAEIVSSLSPIGLSAMQQAHAAATDSDLLDEMRKLEDGGIWTVMGIRNFLEGDIFSWYVSAWDGKLASVVRNLVRNLVEFDPTTLSVEPAESRDLLKKLYQNLFPKSVRHDLGEYYTPDWLADLTLNEVGYDGNPDRRLLDPACGSGTFLVMALNRVMKWFEQNRHQCGFDEAGLAHRILNNVVGFDLNPLAVMAARTNYLLAIRHLLRHVQKQKAELPVYLCDSIMTPAEYGGLISGGVSAERRFHTAGATFHVPTEIAHSQATVATYAEALKRCVGSYEPDEFIAHCRAQGLPIEHENLHKTLFKTLVRLDRENRNGIWANIIKNAFAPVFVGKVDYLVGNPPWVNWESLPESYRNDMKPLWQRYGLFSLSHSAGRLGGGKKDLSMLFVYAGMDHYLRTGGKLGFVITQSVFKTQGAGDGFRTFRYLHARDEAMIIKPMIVHDVSAIQVFEGATNRTAVFVAEKRNQPFDYPVRYVQWRGRGKVAQEEDLDAVLASVDMQVLAATPITLGKPASPWLTAPARAIPGLLKAIGEAHYRGFEGVNTGGLNGCYWVRILQVMPSGELLIENLYDVGKIKVPKVQAALEPDLVYPLMRGRDVRRWIAQPSAHIVLAQNPVTRTGIPEKDMKLRLPNTYAYLKMFEKQLLQRKSTSVKKLMSAGAFYSMFAVAQQTVAPWKVMWRDMGSRIQVVVVGKQDGKAICPEHHVMAVDFAEPQEAHYLCAVLNSAPAECVVAAYTTTTGISAHVLEHIKIPKFKPENDLHQRLCDLSQQSHAAAAMGDTDTLADLELQVDRAAADLWGITDEELAAIQDALRNAPTDTVADQEDDSSDE